MSANKILVTVVSALLLTASCLVAADSEYARESLKKGSWSLQFGIAQNASLTSFGGATVAAKRHYSPSSAIRAGVTVFFDKERTNNYQQARTTTTKQFRSEISLQYLYYYSPSNRLGAFVGTGPRFAYTSGSQELDHGLAHTEQSEWGLGADLLIGGEWFVTSGISLFGEYGLFLGYSSSENESFSGGIGTTARTEAKSYAIQSRGARLGMSLYF